jgi:hypothetical protein
VIATCAAIPAPTKGIGSVDSDGPIYRRSGLNAQRESMDLT